MSTIVLNPLYTTYEDNNELPVYLFSDFEGRPDLLILFLIQSGVIVDKKFKKECLEFIRPEHQPKDYSDADFIKLSELVTELLWNFQHHEGINTDSAILQFLGDYFGNRPLCGKKDANGNTIVRQPNDSDNGKSLLVNGGKKQMSFVLKQTLFYVEQRKIMKKMLKEYTI